VSAILAGVLPVFALIALGWGLKATGFIPAETWRPIERVTYFVFYPGFLIPTIWTAQFEGLASAPLGAASIAAVALIGGAAVLARPFTGLSGPAFASVFQGLVRWNSFVFLPVVVAVFGEPGLARAAVVIGALVPVINIMAVLALARWGEGQSGGWGPAGRALLRNPILWSCGLGLLLNALRVPPGGVDDALDLLGDGALPLGLLVAGAGLNFAAASARPVSIAVVCTVKLVVMPVLMWSLCRAFGGDELSQGVALACGSAPGAAASYVLARQMGGDAPLMAGIVAFTTLASVATIPLLLLLFGLP
jgi:predicted permease